MCRAAKFPNKQIYRMCVAGNTTMNHLFAGVNADPVRMEPYIPTFYKTNSLYASDLGLTVNPPDRYAKVCTNGPVFYSEEVTLND